MSEADNEYYVDKILDRKIENGISYYLIKWHDYSDSENSWEPESNLNCYELLQEFLIEEKKKKDAKKNSEKNKSNEDLSNQENLSTNLNEELLLEKDFNLESSNDNSEGLNNENDDRRNLICNEHDFIISNTQEVDLFSETDSDEYTSSSDTENELINSFNYPINKKPLKIYGLCAIDKKSHFIVKFEDGFNYYIDTLIGKQLLKNLFDEYLIERKITENQFKKFFQ